MDFQVVTKAHVAFMYYTCFTGIPSNFYKTNQHFGTYFANKSASVLKPTTFYDPNGLLKLKNASHEG